jgi:SPP1 gp7 family putative phage head morphogenesis protein
MADFKSENYKHIHRLQGLSNGLADDIAKTLEGALDVVTGKIVRLAAKAEQTESLVRKKKYLDKQKAEIEKVLDDIYSDIGSKIQEKSVEVALETPEILRTIASQTLKIDLALPHLDKKLVNSWFNSFQVEGMYFNKWLSKIRENAAARIVKEAKESIILQEPFRETAKRIQTALNVTRNSASGLAQNAIFQMHNQAELEFFEENQDIIDRVRFTAELDIHTSALCISLDSRVYKLGEAPLPPLHWRCRSRLEPVFSEERLNKIAGKRIARLETGKRTIHHKDGSTSTRYEKMRVQDVPNSMTYTDWMKSLIKSENPKDVAFAKETLGKTRFDLVAAGKLNLESLYYHGKLRTIRQLKELL